MQFDFKITTLRTSGNNLSQHKLCMALLGIRVARAETDLLKGFESLSYGKPYITFVILHKSRDGMGGIPIEVLSLSSSGSARCVAQGLQQGCTHIY